VSFADIPNPEKIVYVALYLIEDFKLEKFPNLRALSVYNATDEDLVPLEYMDNLSLLDLRETPITNAGLSYLSNLTNLRELYLGETSVTEAGADKLQKALPNCYILSPH